MLKKATFVLAALFFMCGACAIPFEQLLYKGRAVPFYNDSSKPEQQLLLDNIKKGHLAERMANLTNSALRLRSDIGVGFESCGQVSAFFSPQRRANVICTEFLDMMAKTAFNDREFMMKLPRDQSAKALDGLVWGIFFHELAHAVIFTNTAPVTGREEDVADQFAVWFAVNFVDLNQTPIITPTIWFWSRLAKERDLPSMTEQERRRLMSNDHSLDEQRVFNLACWVLGTGTDGGAKTAQFAGFRMREQIGALPSTRK